MRVRRSIFFKSWWITGADRASELINNRVCVCVFNRVRYILYTYMPQALKVREHIFFHSLFPLRIIFRRVFYLFFFFSFHRFIVLNIHRDGNIITACLLEFFISFFKYLDDYWRKKNIDECCCKLFSNYFTWKIPKLFFFISFSILIIVHIKLPLCENKYKNPLYTINFSFHSRSSHCCRHFHAHESTISIKARLYTLQHKRVDWWSEFLCIITRSYLHPLCSIFISLLLHFISSSLTFYILQHCERI